MSTPVRILAKGPFNYQFKGARRYFLIGDYYLLNPEVPAERAELEYVLSPHFPYGEYVHISAHPFLTQYAQAVAQATYLEPVPTVTRPTPPEVVPAYVATQLSVEPEPEPIPEIKPVVVAAPVIAPVVPEVKPVVAPVAPVVKPTAPVAAPVIKPAAPVDRATELSNLTLRELQDLTTSLGIEFKSKTLAIEAIVSKEQGSNDTNPKGN